MNEEIKQQWIDALTSGEYAQGRKVLRTKDNTYCCLGVLCDLAVKKGIARWAKRKDSEDWAIVHIDEDIDDATADIGYGLLPRFIREWSEITSDDGSFKLLDGGFKEPNAVTLTELNDVRKYNFSKIAKAIKENL